MFTPSPSFFQRPAPACADPDAHQNGCDCAWVTATFSRVPEDLRQPLQKKYWEIRGEIHGAWPTINELRADNLRRVAANQFCSDCAWAWDMLATVTEDFRVDLWKKYLGIIGGGEGEEAGRLAANRFLLAACK